MIINTKPRRIITATRRSECSICIRPIKVGERIGLLPDRLPGQKWVHLGCIRPVSVRRANAEDDRNPVP